MPRDTNGQYSLPPNIEGIPLEIIESADWNNFIEDVEQDANNPRPIIAGGTAAGSAVGGLDNLNTISTPIVAAATTDLSAASGVHVTITGSTTITSLGSEQAGAIRYVTLAGTPLITYNATSLILPTSSSIQGEAGDTFMAVSLGTGNWVVIHYQRRSGAALAGSGGSIVADLDSLYIYSTYMGAL